MGTDGLGRLSIWLMVAWGLVGGLALGAQGGKGPPGALGGGLAEQYQPGEVILKLKPGAPEEVARTLAAQMQGEVAKQVPEYRLYLLIFPAAPDPAAQKAQLDEIIKRLKAHPQVEAAYPNYRVSIPPQPVIPSPRKPGF
jgi:hypothetical protein